jgi:NADH-quinone oxidoreductase subunit M
VAALAATGVVLGAAYMLYLYKRVVFGELTKADVKAMPDMGWREIAVFAPLIGLVFWMGVYPSSFINPMAPALEKVIARYNSVNADSLPPLVDGE